MGIKKEIITGILISESENIGTLSEGLSYWIKPTDEYGKQCEKIFVRKKTLTWQIDPELNKFLWKTVMLFEEIIETKDTITMQYDSASEAK